MLRDLKKSGFASIVEIIITTVVFVIAAAGILSTILMFRPQGKGSALKLEAAYVGQGFIDDLRNDVNAEEWNDSSGSLWPDTYSTTSGIYTIDYVITEPSANLRYLTMNVTFPDP